jgi:soluble lytic murein transglycosylase-like protein
MTLVPQIIRETINIKAAEFDVDPDLIEAFVMTESSGNPKATRYEPNFYKAYIQPLLVKQLLTPMEAIDRATSWGLMQIMGQTARERGFNSPFIDLYEPATGLHWGITHLKKQMKRYKEQGEDYAIAAYNAGSARMENGRFVNQGYVDRMRGYLKQIKEA